MSEQTSTSGQSLPDNTGQSKKSSTTAPKSSGFQRIRMTFRSRGYEEDGDPVPAGFVTYIPPQVSSRVEEIDDSPPYPAESASWPGVPSSSP
jgi:hypothetical protein